MAARLRFAISTAAIPDVLMIDEALATGDAGFRERSRIRVEENRPSAGTAFGASHSLASMPAMCERAIWIDKGVVRMDGPADEVAAEYRTYVKALRAERARIRAARKKNVA